MQKVTPLLLSSVLLVAPALAWSHGGIHHGGLLDGLAHIAGSPTHLLAIAAAAGVAWIALRIHRRGKRTR